MNTVDAIVSPEGSLEVLSQREVNELCDASDSELFEQFRRCCLAVLNSGAHVDNAHEVLAAHRDFQVQLMQRERGIQIALRNAPPTAFVDGKMIRGIRELLFAVLRDIVFGHRELRRGSFDLTTSPGITNAV